MKPDTPALITSALTVNEFIGAPVVGTENGVAKLKTDGAELIMTAVAGPVALSIKPSRARSDPSSVSEEKVESQRVARCRCKRHRRCQRGCDQNHTFHARSQVARPPKKASRLRDGKSLPV